MKLLECIEFVVWLFFFEIILSQYCVKDDGNWSAGLQFSTHNLDHKQQQGIEIHLKICPRRGSEMRIAHYQL